MLTCPDLKPHFRHAVWRPMPHSFGVPVGSDWADKRPDDPLFGLYKNCGFWCEDEVAILYECARQIGGTWLDIGAHTGWTTAHLCEAGCFVVALEPMWRIEEFEHRAEDNLTAKKIPPHVRSFLRSDEFFDGPANAYNKQQNSALAGVVIDGDHDRPRPMEDAQNSAKHLANRGVILLHDAIGAPVQEAVLWLVGQGFQCKVYPTVHVVAVCWRGKFSPPTYHSIPRVVAGVSPHIKAIARFL